MRRRLLVRADDLDSRESAVLEAYYLEYRTLREELLGTIKSRNEVLAFGIAGVSVLLAAAANAASRTPDNRSAVTFIDVALVFIAPVLVVAVYALWCAEFLRMVRASQHLASLESLINDLLFGRGPRGPHAVTWELSRRGGYPVKYEPVTLLHALAGLVRSSAERFAYATGIRPRPSDDGRRHWRGEAMIDLHWPLSLAVLAIVTLLPAFAHYVTHETFTLSGRLYQPWICIVWLLVFLRFAKAEAEYAQERGGESSNGAAEPAALNGTAVGVIWSGHASGLTPPVRHGDRVRARARR